MDIQLDATSEVPLYQQLRDRVVEGIAAGRLRTGETLSPVRRLAAAFGVNPATIGKGYDLLRGEGLVTINAKSGTFVRRDRDVPLTDSNFVDAWFPRLVTLLAEGRAQGLGPERIREICDAALESFERE